MRFQRYTIATSYAASSLAWRQAGRLHLLEPVLAEIVVVVACNPNPVSLNQILKATGASKEFILKRAATLISQQYLTKGTHSKGAHITGYNLGPKGVQFFNDYKVQLRKVKKELLAA